jgi:hypothetical protein
VNASLPLSFHIVESAACVVQFRFPRTKKRRIRNKWINRPGNFRPSVNVFVSKEQNTVICHPIIARRLRAELATLRATEVRP